MEEKKKGGQAIALHSCTPLKNKKKKRGSKRVDVLVVAGVRSEILSPALEHHPDTSIISNILVQGPPTIHIEVPVVGSPDCKVPVLL